jgi:hypothetical protein
MDWECAQLSTTVFGGNLEAGWIVDPETVRQDYTDPTLMATRQFSLASLKTINNTNPFFEYAAIGIIRWDHTDSTVPLNAPGPLRNCDADWIVRIVFLIAPATAIGSNLSSNIFDNTHLSKAKRRLGNNSGILACFETAATAGNYSVAFGLDARCLIKE